MQILGEVCKAEGENNAWRDTRRGTEPLDENPSEKVSLGESAPRSFVLATNQVSTNSLVLTEKGERASPTNLLHTLPGCQTKTFSSSK